MVCGEPVTPSSTSFPRPEISPGSGESRGLDSRGADLPSLNRNRANGWHGEPSGSAAVTSRRAARLIPALEIGVWIGLLVLSGIMLLGRTSPYIDTSYQIIISRTPTIGAFGHRVLQDNQGPAAQLVFWAGAQLGLSSIVAQRVLSLALASLAYGAAVALGTFWGASKNRTAQPTGLPGSNGLALAFGTMAAVVAPGVLATSGLVRYSALVGPFWLLSFLLVVRALQGDTAAPSRVGATLSLGILVGYTTAVLAICVVVCLLVGKTITERRNLMGLVRGIALGAIPLVVWLPFVILQTNRIATRVNPGGVTRTARAIVGKSYELAAWLFVGPASLPTPRGLPSSFARPVSCWAWHTEVRAALMCPSGFPPSSWHCRYRFGF